MTKLPARIGPSNDLQSYECPSCGEMTLSGTTTHDVDRGDMIRLRCPCGWRDVRPLKTNNPPVKRATIEESYQAFIDELGDGD